MDKTLPVLIEVSGYECEEWGDEHAMDYLDDVRAKMGIRVDKPPAAAAGAAVAGKKTNGKRTLDPPPGRAKPPAVALCKCKLCGLANNGDRVGRRKGVVPPAGEPTFYAACRTKLFK